MPPLPQPSSPHCRPLQFGAQHKSLVALHWLAGGWQQAGALAQHPVAPAGQFCPLQVVGFAAQRWAKQLLEQQSLFCWQALPFAVQPRRRAQRPFAHWFVQQSPLVLHGWPGLRQGLSRWRHFWRWLMQRP